MKRIIDGIELEIEGDDTITGTSGAAGHTGDPVIDVCHQIIALARSDTCDDYRLRELAVGDLQRARRAAKLAHMPASSPAIN